MSNSHLCLPFYAPFTNQNANKALSYYVESDIIYTFNNKQEAADGAY